MKKTVHIIYTSIDVSFSNISISQGLTHTPEQQRTVVVWNSQHVFISVNLDIHAYDSQLDKSG